ncbi:hypothetical protein GCM10027414_07070 [Humibacter ginsengiterrae]
MNMSSLSYVRRIGPVTFDWSGLCGVAWCDECGSLGVRFHRGEVTDLAVKHAARHGVTRSSPVDIPEPSRRLCARCHLEVPGRGIKSYCRECFTVLRHGYRHGKYSERTLKRLAGECFECGEPIHKYGRCLTCLRAYEARRQRESYARRRAA